MPIEELKKWLKLIRIIIVIESVFFVIAVGTKEIVYWRVENYINSGQYAEAGNLLEKITILGKGKKYAALNEKIDENRKYDYAVELIKEEKYEDAVKILTTIKGYKDADALYEQAINNQSTILLSQYNEAIDLMKKRQYIEAIGRFKELQNYRDSVQKIDECNNCIKRIEFGNVIAAGTWSSAVIGDNKKAKIEIDGSEVIEDAQYTIENWGDLVSVDCLGYYAAGLTADGKVLCQKICNNHVEYDMSSIETIENAIQVDTGTMFVTVLTEDKHVITAGKYTHPGEYLDTSDWSNIVQVAAGRNFIVGLSESGELCFKGKNIAELQEQYEAEKNKWKDIKKIVAGGGEDNNGYPGQGHVVGLTGDGKVVSIGDDTYGQCQTDGLTGDNHAIDISAGDWHTSILLDDNRIINAGNKDGIPQKEYILDSTITDISAGFGYTIYKLKDGRLAYFGLDHNNGVKKLVN